MATQRSVTFDKFCKINKVTLEERAQLVAHLITLRVARMLTWVCPGKGG